ncbi:MAG: mechanosensitive ion channel domain-containing protein [Bacteroidota bacterium]
MSDFFNYSFYETDLLNITVGKLLALIFIIFITRLILRFYKVFVHKKIRALDVFDKEREALFLKAGKNVIRLLGVIAAVMSLGLMPLLNAIFAFPLLTTEKVNVTVGNVLVLIIILVITRILARLVRIIIKKNFSRKAWVDEGKEYTVFKLTKYGLYGFAILLGLTSIGIDMKLILAGAGALLVGIGFGLQYLFYDLISGLIILFEGPIKVGDVIEVDGLVAKVKQIDIRTSKVITRNGKYIIIPNSKLIGEKVVNWSHGSELTRFNVEVGVKYGSDTALVKEVLYNCVLRHPDVSKNREIIVRFDNFGDSALIFTVFFWAKKTWVVETLQSEIRFEIDREFREKGITVPFPQRDIHIISNPDSKKS